MCRLEASEVVGGACLILLALPSGRWAWRTTPLSPSLFKSTPDFWSFLHLKLPSPSPLRVPRLLSQNNPSSCSFYQLPSSSWRRFLQYNVRLYWTTSSHARCLPLMGHIGEICRPSTITVRSSHFHGKLARTLSLQSG